jgi:hypothetical protein
VTIRLRDRRKPELLKQALLGRRQFRRLGAIEVVGAQMIKVEGAALPEPIMIFCARFGDECRQCRPEFQPRLKRYQDESVR